MVPFKQRKDENDFPHPRPGGGGEARSRRHPSRSGTRAFRTLVVRAHPWARRRGLRSQGGPSPRPAGWTPTRHGKRAAGEGLGGGREKRGRTTPQSIGRRPMDEDLVSSCFSLTGPPNILLPRASRVRARVCPPYLPSRYWLIMFSSLSCLPLVMPAAP